MLFVPLSEAPLSALQLPALAFLLILVVAVDLLWFWDHSIVLPCSWVSFHAHLLCLCSRPQVLFVVVVVGVFSQHLSLARAIS